MTLTHWIVLITFAAWIWYTAVSRQLFGAPTISMTLRNMAWDFSVFPFIWGMLIAHWFAPRQEILTGLWGWGVGLPIIVLLASWDVWRLWTNAPREAYRWPFWYFLAGLPVGYWFWPQLSKDAPW